MASARDVQVDAFAREAAGALNLGAAAETEVGDPLAGGVALDGVGVANLRLETEIAHGALPVGSVIGRLEAVARDRQEMGVLVTKGFKNGRLVFENERREADDALSVVRHPRGHAIWLPLQDGGIAQGESGGQPDQFGFCGRPELRRYGRLFHATNGFLARQVLESASEATRQRTGTAAASG